MNADDLDATLACLTDAAVSMEGLDAEEMSPELQSGFLSLQTRINSLITFTEAYQRKVSLVTRRTVRAVKPAPVESTILEEEEELLDAEGAPVAAVEAVVEATPPAII
jgi:hypothetical protein